MPQVAFRVLRGLSPFARVPLSTNIAVKSDKPKEYFKSENQVSIARPLVILPSVRQDECEEYLALIADGQVDEISFPEKLVSAGAFGLDAMLSHLAVAKARQPDGLRLRIPADVTDVNLYLDQLGLTAYGFAALAFASQLSDSAGTRLPIGIARSRKRRRLEEISSYSERLFLFQEGLSLPSIYGEQSEQATWMYSHSAQSNRVEVQSPAEIQGWLNRAAAQILPEEFRSLFDQTRRESLCTIAFELIENAAQHGRYDAQGAKLPLGIRGLSMRLVDIGLGEATEIAGGNPAVNMYFNRRIYRDKKQDGRFMELTVFDSGIGFHNWLNAECNDNERTRRLRGKPVKETVRACVFMHASSKGHDGTGVGLYRATRLLKEMFGFVRIRTGTECYFARLDQTLSGEDRKLGGDRDDAANPHVELEEWFPERKLADVGGSSITFGIPLINWRRS